MKERKLNKIKPDLFLKLYNQGYSDSYISKQMDCNSETIRMYRKRKGLEANTQVSKINKFKNDENLLKMIYLNKYSKNIDFFKNLGISESTYYILKSFIKENNIGVFQEDYIPDQYEKSIIIGCLFGDGYITKNKNIASFIFQHGEKQKNYCYHKAEKLKNIISYTKENLRYDERFKIKNYKSICTYSKGLKFLAELRKKVYLDKKTITLEVLEEMNFNEISLAYLYMDDGSYCNKKYVFYLNNFSEESLIVLKNYLYNKLDLLFNIKKTSSGYIMHIDKSFKGLFIKKIFPHLHESMYYKIGLLTGLNGEYPEVDNPVPMTLEIKEC
jgi:hypothetical protein